MPQLTWLPAAAASGVQQSHPDRQLLASAHQEEPVRLGPQTASHPLLRQLQQTQRTWRRPALHLLLQRLQQRLLQLPG
jgi:hypothetical protein